jgi:HSP20 family molecular chaperone IbpA
MSERQRFGDEVAVRRYEYDDGAVLAADFSPASEAAVDVLGDTVILVVDGEQHELELEVEGDANAFISNGVLTVEVDA